LVGSFPNFGSNDATVFWSPDEQYALVRTGAGHFLWNRETPNGIMLTSNDPRPRINGVTDYPDVYWDFERGQLLLSIQSGTGIYDLRNGVRK
jgi:hypothetical protein